MIATQQRQPVQRTHQRILRLAAGLELRKRRLLAGQQQTTLAHVHEFKQRRGRLARFHAESAEPLKLLQRRRADPAEVAAREFDVSLVCIALRRIRLPERVAITLLIETAIGRDAANLARLLKQTQRHRQRRRDAQLLPGLAQAAHLQLLAQRCRFLRPFRQSLEYIRLESVDLPLRRPSAQSALQCAVVRKTATRMQAQRKVARGQHIGASARTRQFVNLQLRRCGIGLLARDARARKQRQVRRATAHRTRPARPRQHLRGGRPIQRSIQALLLPPPGAQLHQN